MKQSYTVTEEADTLAPRWLADRINLFSVKFVCRIIDGAVKLKGVRIGNEMAEIGDHVLFDGRRLSVEKRRPNISELSVK